MADETDNPFEEGKSELKAAEPGVRRKAILRLGFIGLVLAAGSAAGYAVGGLFQGSGAPDANQPAPAAEPFEEPPPPAPNAAGDEFEYVDFEPIVANLNEPRLARYARATITLAIRKRDAATATEAIERQKKELRNWLTVYLAGKTLEDVRGPASLNRMTREIQDACNEQLWPRRRPLIDHVLFKEFAVQ